MKVAYSYKSKWTGTLNNGEIEVQNNVDLDDILEAIFRDANDPESESNVTTSLSVGDRVTIEFTKNRVEFGYTAAVDTFGFKNKCMNAPLDWVKVEA